MKRILKVAAELLCHCSQCKLHPREGGGGLPRELGRTFMKVGYCEILCELNYVPTGSLSICSLCRSKSDSAGSVTRTLHVWTKLLMAQ